MVADDVHPADLGLASALDGAAERVRHHLVAEADAEHRHTPTGCLVDDGHLGRHVVRDLRPVHAPLAAQQHHQLVPVERRPLARVLAVALVERVPVRAEPLADEAGIRIIGVGDEQGAHGRYRTALMCGIVGCLHPGEGADALTAQVARMADTLVHRGPDGGDVWANETEGVALGFRRLAVVDLTPTGMQPMASHSGRYTVVYNGEIYNHHELRRELSGVAWRGSSDTETLLATFDRWGVVGALPRLVGMFAIAVWDHQQRTLTLARDRIGEKPMFYGVHRGVLLFGSELKALRAHPAFDGEVDASCSGARTCTRRSSRHRRASGATPTSCRPAITSRLVLVISSAARCPHHRRTGRCTSTLADPPPTRWVMPRSSIGSTQCCARRSAGRWWPTCRWARSSPAASTAR
jgi:hypothetical protein